MAVHTLGTRPPLIQVGLSVGQTYLSRRLGGPPVLRTALIDTGSVMTAIDPTDRDGASPAPTRRRLMSDARAGRSGELPHMTSASPSNPTLRPARWWLHGHWFELEAVEALPASPAVDVLIGQDLLDRLVMSWDGPRGRLLLMY